MDAVSPQVEDGWSDHGVCTSSNSPPEEPRDIATPGVSLASASQSGPGRSSQPPRQLLRFSKRKVSHIVRMDLTRAKVHGAAPQRPFEELKERQPKTRVPRRQLGTKRGPAEGERRVARVENRELKTDSRAVQAVHAGIEAEIGAMQADIRAVRAETRAAQMEARAIRAETANLRRGMRVQSGELALQIYERQAVEFLMKLALGYLGGKLVLMADKGVERAIGALLSR